MTSITSPLDSLRALSKERDAIQIKLKPLHDLTQTKRAEHSAMLETVAAAGAALDAAVKQSATVAAMRALGTATDQDVKDAQTARQLAQKAHAAAQTQSAGQPHIQAEISAYEAAGRDLTARLQNIGTEEAALKEVYLRALADDAAKVYADTARSLAAKLAEVLAYQQALAAANYEPDLITAGVWNFGIPALNSPSARTAGGYVADINSSRQQQPKVFAAIRARLVADGVSIPGL